MADEGQAKFKAVITAEDETAGAFASVQRAFERLGLTAEQVEKEIAHLGQVDEEDRLAQHFQGAEAELRRMGLTAEAVRGEMERLRAAQAEVAEGAGVGALDQAIGFFHRHAHHGEGEGEGGGHRGGEHEGGGEHSGGSHGWESIGGHIDILRGHFGRLRENIGETGESIGEMLPMLGAFGALASAAGLLEMIHSTAEEQSALAAMAAQLGVTANQLEAFNEAANLADVPVDAMDRSLGKFGVTVAKAASGKDKTAAQMFKQMGISLEDAQHHLLPMTTLLPEVAQALKNTHDPQMRLYIATALFGRAGRDMLPLLIQGAQHLKELTTEADKLGPALTDVDRNHLEQFNDAWKEAEYVSQSFMTKLSAELAPVLTPLLDDFTRWAAANKDLIAHDLAGFIKRAAREMEQFPWQTAFTSVSKVATTIAGAATDINDVVTSTVGWKAVLVAFAAYKLTSPFAAILEDGARLLSIGNAAVLMFGPKLKLALSSSEEAFIALNAVFERTPLGLAILAGFGLHEAFVWGDQQIGPNPHPSRPNQPGWAERNNAPDAENAPATGVSPDAGDANLSWHDRHRRQMAAESARISQLTDHHADGPAVLLYQPLAVPPALTPPSGVQSSAPSPSPAPSRRQVATGVYRPLLPAPAPMPAKPHEHASWWDHARDAAFGLGSDLLHPFGMLSPPAAPSLGGSGLAQPVGQNGTITHHVVFENVPPNVTISTTTSGDVGGYRADVGQNMLGGPQ